MLMPGGTGRRLRRLCHLIHVRNVRDTSAAGRTWPEDAVIVASLAPTRDCAGAGSLFDGLEAEKASTRRSGQLAFPIRASWKICNSPKSRKPRVSRAFRSG